MPELLEAQANLDIQDALSRVDDLGTAVEDRLTTALSTFADLFANVVADVPPIDVQADTSTVAPEIESAIAEGGSGALLEIPVDSATIVGEIDSAVAGATPEPVVIDADTSDAVAAIDDLGSAAGGDGGGGGGGASGKVSGLGDSVKFLEGAATVGTGKLGGLKNVAEGMGTSAVAGYAGVAVLAGGIAELAHIGIDAASANDRVNVTFGDQAKAVKEIDIGGLRGDMGGLASQVGSTNAQLDNSVARLGQYGKAAGLSKQQTLQFTQETTALALRATALNPALGSVDEVVQRMGRGLATGGRFAQQFYLSLNRPDIITHAIELFGGTATSLNKTQLAAAGADLAVHGLGNNLGKDFVTGAASADNQARSVTAGLKNMIEEIAKPLVAPFLAVLKEGVPIAADFGHAIAIIGSTALPVLKALGPAIEPAVVAFVAFKLATVVLPAVLELTATGVVLLGSAFEETAAKAVGGAIAIEGVTAGIEASTGLIGIGIGILAVAASAFGLFGGSAEEAKTDLDKLGQQSDATFKSISESLARFYAVASKKGGILGEIASDNVQRALKDFRSLANQNIDAAQRYGQALLDAGVITEGQFTSALNHAIKAQQDHAHALTENAAAATKFSLAQQTTIFATDLETAAADRSSNIHKNAVSIAESLTAAGNKNAEAVRAQATAYASASQNATDFKASLDVLNAGTLSLAEAQNSEQASLISVDTALKAKQASDETDVEFQNKREAAVIQSVHAEQSLEVAMKNANKTTEEVNAQHAAYIDQLKNSLSTYGYTDDAIQGMLIKLGLVAPAVSTAAGSLASLPAAAKEQLGATLSLFNETLPQIASELQAQMTSGAADYASAIAGLPVSTREALSAAAGIVGITMPQLAQQLLAGGASGAASYLDSITGSGGLGASTETATKQALDKVAPGAWDLPSKVADIGFAAGSNLDTAMAYGISSMSDVPEAAAAELIKAIKRIFKQSSPSKVFLDIGAQNAAGLIGGMADNMIAGIPDVVSAAEQITREAARAVAVANSASFVPSLPGPAPGSSPIPGGGGRSAGPDIVVEKIEVQVIGVSDPAAAYAAGQAAGEGVRAGLDGSQRRSIVTGVKTG